MDKQTKLKNLLIEFFHLQEGEVDTIWQNDRRKVIGNILKYAELFYNIL